ncbi:MAG: putative manganese transporter [Clostridia bacterium]|nr:putative manganese transporter [Clostridia bacterium]
MLDALLEALLDTLKTLPFLFGAYLLIEYLEHKASDKISASLTKLGHFGPIGGAVLGTIPQCGFSVAAANFFTERDITPGTLIAVFIATSDEAIPVLIAHPEMASSLWKLILIKVVFAIVAGFITDICFRKAFSVKKNAKLHDDCEKEQTGNSILHNAIKHSAQIFVFIFIVNVILCLMFYYIGEDSIAKLFMSESIFQPFLTALIGFIPNCAASVVLTELFVNGSISLGSLVAGLSTGAGLGLAVLFKTNKSMKENFTVMGILYVLAALVGLGINFVI